MVGWNEIVVWSEPLIGVSCGLAVMAVWMLFTVLDIRRFLRPGTRWRRGVPVWRGRIPEAWVGPLEELSASTDPDWGWVRRRGDRLVVRVSPNVVPRDRSWKYSTSWPYVAVVDLRRRRVTYRQPLSTTLFVVPHLIVFFPFVAAMAVVNHRVQAASVRAGLGELAGMRDESKHGCDESAHGRPAVIDKRVDAPRICGAMPAGVSIHRSDRSVG